MTNGEALLVWGPLASRDEVEEGDEGQGKGKWFTAGQLQLSGSPGRGSEC